MLLVQRRKVCGIQGADQKFSTFLTLLFFCSWRDGVKNNCRPFLFVEIQVFLLWVEDCYPF